MGRQRGGGGRGGGGGGQPKAAGRGVQKPSAKGGGRKGKGGGKAKPKTAEQLDADLAAYVASKEAGAAAVKPTQLPTHPQAQRVKKEPPVVPDKEALDADMEAYRLAGLAVKETPGEGADPLT